ncbi:MAG: calcium/sodium antiporter [Proteobacteria bacterium]|nr:calcium/sodium antiporter [Pseudomonadota bacterium]
MIIDGIQLLAGLALLLAAGESLVRGAAGLAQGLGLSPLFVGLTLVAFGTSAPELAVNAIASLRGQGDLSFGNIIGSNLANIGLVLGTASLVAPLAIQPQVLRRDLPIMYAATGFAVLLLVDGWRSLATSQFDRVDGALLLVGFVVFLSVAGRDLMDREEGDEDEVHHGRAVAADVGWLLLGAVGLAAGARMTVGGAEGLAFALGVPELIIGITIVSVGTSLPELVTSIIAVRKGHIDLAVGNVVGSNLFNLLLVMGVTACLRPVPTPVGGAADLTALCGVSILLGLLARTAGNHITRSNGVLLLLIYCAYVTARTFGGVG